MKPGARIINCARGGLVDEEALYDAIKNGTIAGAALDVFSQEPPPADHPLLQLDQVIATPHLGASTTEAQEGVAFTVAEQMRDYLTTGALAGRSQRSDGWFERTPISCSPTLSLLRSWDASRRNSSTKPVSEVRIEFAGEIVDIDAAPVTRAFLSGSLRDVSARVNVVNAFLIADERGIKVTTTYVRTTGDATPAIHTEIHAGQSRQSLAGSSIWLRQPRRAKVA